MRANLIALVAVLSSALTGCVIRDQRTEPAPQQNELAGDINFLWNFQGKNCSQTPAVRQVHVFVGNEPLDNNGFFPCNAGGTDGIRLKNFAPGNYNFTVDGVDAGNKTIYTTTGTVHVNGSITQQVSLNPLGGTEKMQIFWAFSRVKDTCASARVTKIKISVNHGEFVTRNCSEIDPQTHAAVEGVAISNIDAGSYQVVIDGYQTDPVSKADQLAYSATVNLPVVAGGQNNFNVTLDRVAAQASFKFTFNNQPSCSAAGVQAIWIQLIDSKNQTVGDPKGYILECAKYELGIPWDYLPAADSFDPASQTWFATYTVRMEGWDSPYATGHRVLYAGNITTRVFAGDNTVLVAMSKL